MPSQQHPAKTADPTDAELMRRVQAGDALAFQMIYDRSAGAAYRLARGVARDDTLAQDVVQEAFLSVWRSRASYAPERGSVGNWILGTVRNRAIDALRRNGRHDVRRAAGEDLGERVPAPGDLEDGVLERDQAERLRSTLTRLPKPQREVIALAYFGELSTSEIALALAIPHGTVKGRMRLGLRSLRMRLDVSQAA